MSGGRMPEEAYRIIGLDGPDANGHQPLAANPTDLGNAVRLVARHGEDLRYVHAWKRFLVWDGKRWKIDAAGEVERRAFETVRSIYTEAENAPDADERKAIAKHAMSSEARPRIEAMIALARALPGVGVEPEQLDADPWLFTCENGTLDLRTGDLQPHRRADLITKLAPVEYDPGANAPRFARFLREVLANDGVITFLQRFAGYSLTGSTRERVFSILHGSGKNGKTTLVELLRDVLGDYARNTDIETVLQKDYRGAGNDIAALRGARFVSAAEVERGRHLAESRVKNLTGSDTVTARFLFAEFFDFRPQFKLWLSTNNKPVIKGTDDAIWDRIRLVPFTERFVGNRRDPDLPEKLREELPGVLAWMVRGCLDWQRDGLGEPEEVQTATAEYRSEMDHVSAFISERCITGPDVWVEFKGLYQGYESWCAAANETPEKRKTFAMMLTDRGYRAHSGAKNVAIRRGIALRHDGDPDPAKVNDPGPDSPPREPDSAPSDEEIVNPVNDEGAIVNPQNTCKTGGSEKRVNDGYRKTENFPSKNPRVREFQKNVNHRSPLTVEEVAAELRRAGSGPALALRYHLPEPENRQRLEYLARAVLTARGEDTSAWEDVAGVVAEAAADPNNHPIGCRCGCEE